MTSAVQTFKKLSPCLKALYVTSLLLSVALMVFGAVLLTGTGEGSAAASNNIGTSENSAGLGSGGSVISDYGDDWNDFDDTPFPTPVRVVDSPQSKPTFAPVSLDPSKYTISPVSITQTTSAPTMKPMTSSQSPSSSPITKRPTHPPSKRPSARPTHPPSSRPTTSPTEPKVLTDVPTASPSTDEPTRSPSPHPSARPTDAPSSSFIPTSSSAPTTPLFPNHFKDATIDTIILNNLTYFNYNTTKGSLFGPSNWESVSILNNSQNYWREFGFVENQCNLEGNGAQSPMDVCAKPERHCEEYHEFRSKRGDFKISNSFMIKQILPSKLRVLVTRRTGEEPDPPHVDFAGIGAKDLDLLNIDVKFPSEHKVCGRTFDGEMQYYFFHPVKRSLLVVAWLLEAKEENEVNQHMQELIDEFQKIYDDNEQVCLEKDLEASLLNEASSAVRGGGMATDETNRTASLVDGNPLLRRKLAKDNNNKKRAVIWDPFHRDIQKTIHFWGYTGSLTEPPCTGNTLWRIMDVPVSITPDQLYQMQNTLFNNRGPDTCAYTSIHNKGSVARPIPLTEHNAPNYYKCTRSDYVSDDEREVCGDDGCVEPFGTGLDPYVEPIVHVTGPPSESPTMLQS